MVAVFVIAVTLIPILMAFRVSGGRGPRWAGESSRFRLMRAPELGTRTCCCTKEYAPLVLRPYRPAVARRVADKYALRRLGQTLRHSLRCGRHISQLTA